MSSGIDTSMMNRENSTSNVSANSSNRLSITFRSRRSMAPRDSQDGTASERRSISFFKNFFAQRHNDYRADVPSEARYQSAARPRSSIRSSGTGSGRSSPPPPEDPSSGEDKPSWFSFPSQDLLNAFSTIIESRLWGIIIFCNTFLLLFGSEIRDLWIPPQGDIVMDVLFIIALAVFCFDIIMRCFLEPLYMPWCGRKKGRCSIGSFMFWCDVVSTSTLLYNISFINGQLLERLTVDIVLNSLGIPVDGLDDVNKSQPVEPSVDLLILIGRTARVARFIRQSTVVNSRRFQFYWAIQRSNPLWYLDGYRQRRSSRALSLQASAEGGSSDPTLRSSRPQLVRSASWGGLQMAVMAKTRSYPKEPEPPRGIKGMGTRALRAMGLKRNDNEEFRRQIAATKIQRAWRARIRNDSRDLGDDDVAWRGGTSSTDAKKSHNHMGIMNLRRRGSQTKRPNLAKSVKNTIKASQAPSRRRPESQVGSAMRELTGQRVALGIIIALVLTVLFTYSEDDATRPSAMIVLHNQTASEEYGDAALDAARATSIPDLYRYRFANNETRSFSIAESSNPDNLREREKVQISVADTKNMTTVGLFAFRDERRNEAWVEICTTLFILLVWFFGVTAFAGPVMTLVVIPIERMIRLLGMLMMDPLGYQSTSRYKRFVAEEEELTKNTRWTKEVLKGMETSFLMSTILRIGSLMKVGFGSAGVEIIRNNLETGQSKNMLILNSQGSTVSCIFLFCDVRQFTDATECLQEEVFVFTNRIAGVVHSICHSYGGSANKNVGDAFLLSWLLDDGPGSNPNSRVDDYYEPNDSADDFSAKHSQADKALLSVVKISIALHHDEYYLEPLSESAREGLLAKLSKRKGPVVQMGFGLHAGKAVQGAIGSQRKIDATYVSESVERAEFLESSTKKYGLKMLMSDSFHRLLHPGNRRRCRKIDQILIRSEEDEEDDEAPVDESDIMELFTFDMDIDALWRPAPKPAAKTPVAPIADDDSESVASSRNENTKGSRRDIMRSPSVRAGGLLNLPRRRSITRIKSGANKQRDDDSSEELHRSGGLSPTEVAAAAVNAVAGAVTPGGNHDNAEESTPTPPELVLPTGPALYNANVWLSEDMRRIRQLYSDGLFFQKFNSGFLAYYGRDWEYAKQCFQTILERFDDGPSRYFLNLINENNGVPPRDFKPYGTA